MHHPEDPDMLKRHALISAGSRPTVHFFMKVAVFIGAFLFVYRDEFLGRLLDPWVELTARATLYCLHLLNMEALRAAAVIHHPGGFAYEIYYRCTGVLPVAVFAALTMAAHASLRQKLFGLVMGIPLLILLNLVRLVHLFDIGIHHPGAFELVHGIFWEAVIMAATLGLWCWWCTWAGRTQSPP
jgi:exosortase/archaeosortase family protein